MSLLAIGGAIYNSTDIELIRRTPAGGAPRMGNTLTFSVDKFTFTVPTDRQYHPDGLWVQARDGRLAIGLTDYRQQNSGDVAFVEMAEPGTVVAAGERLGNVETIKVDIELASPVSGTVIEVNEKLELEAEIINQDPVSYTHLDVYKRQHVDVLGERGRLELNRPFTGLVAGERRLTFVDAHDNAQEIPVEEQELYSGEVEDMHDAILDGRPPYLGLDETRNHVRTVLALYESARRGERVFVEEISD